MPAQHALKHIDGATRLMRAAARSSDPREVELLLGVVHAWLEVARYHLSTGRSAAAANANHVEPEPDR